MTGGLTVADKDLDGQLQAFFEHNPLDDDMLYLKSYVKEHPENKMGWYLLGKEYALRNKPGKAKYCFAQAGEVYEAFEKQKVKLSILDEVKAGQPMLPGQKSRGKTAIRAAKVTAGVLAFLLLGSYMEAETNKREEAAPSASAEVDAANDGSSSSEAVPGLRVLYTDPLERGSQAEQMVKLLLPGKERSERTLLVEGRLTSDGKWVNGLRTPELVASAAASTDGTALQVAYHKAEACNCKPAADPQAEKEAADWAKRQEETAIVESAVRAYQSRYGKELPDSLDGLMRDYPNNILPGYTGTMKQVYASILAASANGGGKAVGGAEKGTGSPAATAAAAASANGTGYLQEPLEIIVDKKAFRLALVSGNVILRSYPVGLGGSRTPEGVFTITDKVKNPNGRDDGDFGSRGMQLSDTDYAIHGTKEPKSIGENRSLGCIRMLKEDIEELFDMAPSGTKVTIGSGLLPAEVLRKENPFRMPALREERNPNKVYHWLD